MGRPHRAAGSQFSLDPERIMDSSSPPNRMTSWPQCDASASSTDRRSSAALVTWQRDDLDPGRGRIPVNDLLGQAKSNKGAASRS
jgi:hypothetical protein